MATKRVLAALLTLPLFIPALTAAHGNAGAFAGRHDDAKRQAPTPPVAAPSKGPPRAAMPAKPQQKSAAPTAPADVVKIARADTVEVAHATAGRKVGGLRTFGRVVADPAAMIDVNAFISGEVRRVLVRPGALVRKGEAVATIYSPEFVRTQKSYLALLQNEALQSALREEGRLPNYMQDARANLRWWGLSERDIVQLEKTGEAREELDLLAETDGIVTEVFVQPGQLLNAGDKTMKQFVVLGKSVLRMVARDRPFWIEGYLYPGEEQSVRVGTGASVSLPDGTRARREVAKTVRSIDAKAQRARFFVALKAGDAVPLGASVELELEVGAGEGVWIPAAAVLNQGIAPVAFVQTQPTLFERRRIEVLQGGGTAMRVAGIRAGEAVVTAGKMLLEGSYRMAAAGNAATGSHDH